jgi:hypothetical protein
VLAAAYQQRPGRAVRLADGSLHLQPTTVRALSGWDLSGWDEDAQSPIRSLSSSLMAPVPLQRMLFSATLSNDPEKLAALSLKNPKFFNLDSPDDHGKPPSVASRRRCEGNALPSSSSGFL